MTKITTQQQCTETSLVLYPAFELSSKKWKLGFFDWIGTEGSYPDDRVREFDFAQVRDWVGEEAFCVAGEESGGELL